MLRVFLYFNVSTILISAQPGRSRARNTLNREKLEYHWKLFESELGVMFDPDLAVLSDEDVLVSSLLQE